MTSSILSFLVLAAFSGFAVFTVSAEVLTLPPFYISGGYSITNSFTLCEESIVTISACEYSYTGDPMFYVYMNGAYQFAGDNYSGYCPRVDNQILTPPLGACVVVVIYNYCVDSGSCSGMITATIEPTAGTHRPSIAPTPSPSVAPTRQPTAAPLRYCPSYSSTGRSAYITDRRLSQSTTTTPTAAPAPRSPPRWRL
eukprot:gene9516-6819_t